METPKILKYDEGTETQIRDFQVQDLRNPGPLVYQTPSLRAAPAAQGQKERRFQYDPLLRDVLSTDEETEKLIESRVVERLTELREKTTQEAHEEGYRQGFEKGEANAKQAFEAQAREVIANLEAFFASVEARRDELYEAKGRFLQEMMFRFAEVILQREVLQDKEYLGRKVQEILEKVGAREMIKVIVHPSQLEQIYGVLPDIEKKFSSLRSVSIEPSEQLGITDCVVETDFNRVDATLETQLSSLRELLEKG